MEHCTTTSAPSIPVDPEVRLILFGAGVELARLGTSRRSVLTPSERRTAEAVLAILLAPSIERGLEAVATHLGERPEGGRASRFLAVHRGVVVGLLRVLGRGEPVDRSRLARLAGVVGGLVADLLNVDRDSPLLGAAVASRSTVARHVRASIAGEARELASSATEALAAIELGSRRDWERLEAICRAVSRELLPWLEGTARPVERIARPATALAYLANGAVRVFREEEGHRIPRIDRLRWRLAPFDRAARAPLASLRSALERESALS